MPRGLDPSKVARILFEDLSKPVYSSRACRVWMGKLAYLDSDSLGVIATLEILGGGRVESPPSPTEMNGRSSLDRKASVTAMGLIMLQIDLS